MILLERTTSISIFFSVDSLSSLNNNNNNNRNLNIFPVNILGLSGEIIVSKYNKYDFLMSIIFSISDEISLMELVGWS